MQPLLKDSGGVKLMGDIPGEEWLRAHFVRGFIAKYKDKQDITMIEDTEGTCWMWVYPGCMWAGVPKDMIQGIRP